MISVVPDPAHPAGHALIRVGGAAGAAGTPGLRVQRDPDWGESTLGPDGWQTSDFVLQPDRAEADGADLLLHVGWAVCRHLEAGTYEVSVPGAGIAPEAARWPDIAPLRAGARAVVTPRAAPPDAAAPPITPALVQTAAPPAPAPTERTDPPAPPATAPAKPGGLARWAPIGALVLLAAGGGWYTWQQRPRPPAPTVPDPLPQPAPVTPPPDTPPQPPAPPVPPSLSGLSVPEVLAQAPNPAAVAAEGERRLRGDRRDDGLLLLEVAADRNDAEAAATLARLYDPVQVQPGGPIPPDARQAARYYRDAARGGRDVTDAREALRQMLQGRIQAGDRGADLTLRDFWP